LPASTPRKWHPAQQSASQIDLTGTVGVTAGASAPEALVQAVIERLVKIVDGRAAELGISAEILAPRGEIKALAMGKRDSHALSGWRREEIGSRLLEAIA